MGMTPHWSNFLQKLSPLTTFICDMSHELIVIHLTYDSELSFSACPQGFSRSPRIAQCCTQDRIGTLAEAIDRRHFEAPFRQSAALASLTLFGATN